MRNRRGQRLAIATAIISLGAIAFAVLALKDRLVEEWCLRRIDSADRATRDAAWDRLAPVATEHALRPLFAILLDEGRSDLARARALHVLWVMSQEERIGPLEERPELSGLSRVLAGALVKALEANEKLALVSAGSDEGIEMSSFFLVHRDRRFVGALRVIRVFPDMAGAQMLEEPGQRSMAVGDHVIGLVSRRPCSAPGLARPATQEVLIAR